MPVSDAFHIYDTTLRDGAQQEGLNLSVHDKMNIARHLDDLGVGFIEGGWPGANPKDTEFFALAKKELKLKMKADERKKKREEQERLKLEEEMRQLEELTKPDASK